jgi:hypothetical protein
MDLDNIAYGAITVLSIVASAVGFIIKKIFSKIDQNAAKIDRVEQDVNNVKVAMITNHPHKDDFDNFKRDLTALLTAIISPMNTKLENIETYLRTQVPKRKSD